MIGASSGAAGCAFAESCLVDGVFAAPLPPLMACSIGRLALTDLPGVLLDNLLTLGISRPLNSAYPPEDYMVPGSRDTTRRAAFRLSLQRVKCRGGTGAGRLPPTRNKMVFCSRRPAEEGKNFRCASTESPKKHEVPWPLSFPPVTRKKPPAT